MITYVPQSIKDAAVSRPDWPEIEAAMKRAYGADWRLVSYDEPMHQAEGRRKEQEKMAMGYIDREEAIRAIDEYKGYFQDQISTSNLLTKIEAQCIISDLDDADVAPVVHGKWIRKVENDGYAMSLCSACSFPVHIYWGESKFCPSCGAKMDKED